MAKPILGDIFIGNFPVTQGYGGNPEAYKQFGLAGHNGIDFGVPDNTQIISATNGKVVRVGFDQYGYGNYLEVWDEAQQCATLYAHLKTIVVQMNDTVIRGQSLAYSDNTGNSTGPHLHFGYCRTDANGVRTNKDNGYAGWINPNAYATWDIKNLTEPVKPPDNTDPVVCDKKSVRDMLVTKASAFDAQNPPYSELKGHNDENDRLLEGKTRELDDEIRAHTATKEYWLNIMKQQMAILDPNGEYGLRPEPPSIAGALIQLVKAEDDARMALKKQQEMEKLLEEEQKARKVSDTLAQDRFTALQELTEAKKEVERNLENSKNELGVCQDRLKNRKDIAKFSVSELLHEAKNQVKEKIWNVVQNFLSKIAGKH